MGRQSEADDDAGETVISASSPPARPRDGAAGGKRVASSYASKQNKEGKGIIALASGTFSEETKEEIEAVSEEEGDTANAKKTEHIPSVGMFAAVYQGTQERRPRGRRVAEDSPSVISSPQGGILPGAYAEGGRNGQGGADAYTVTPQESVAPLPEQRDPNEGIPVASEAVVVNNAPLAEAEPAEPKIEEGGEQTEESPKGLSQKQSKLLVFCMFLLVIGIVVAVAIPLSGGDGPGEISSSQQNASDDDTHSPTPSPSVSPAPTSLYDRIFVLLSAYSEDDVLLDSTTPQSQALQWTLGDFEARDWTDDTILHRYALASLFYATAGLSWVTVTDFLLHVPYCEWDGVGCTNGTLKALSLPSENLSGSVPREIGLLTSLTSLDLSGNSLTGSLPTEIGLLTNLKEMNLSYAAADTGLGAATRSLRRRLEDAIPESSSNLRGPIPSEIGLLTSLVTLDLSGNNISGSIPPEIGQLRDIRNLSLHRNLLEGAIPLQLGFLTSLERVSLETNLLSGGVPNALCSSLTMIQELSSDCLAEVYGDKPAEVVCSCCNVCCDVNGVCRDMDVTAFPSSSPSSSFPSSSPTSYPTSTPSALPSSNPSASPSPIPSTIPSSVPSMSPSFNPTPSGTPQPTITASQSPSKSPTIVPSSSPSLRPTNIPTMTQSIPPVVSCRIDEDSCVGNRACNGAVELCTESGSCSGRNACRSADGLSVAQGSCIGTSACQRATGIVSSSSCTDDNSCADFGGMSIGPNSCKCAECCSCYATGELPDIIPSNSCNIRGECCSTPSPTVSPTKNPTQRPTTAAPTTPRPTPNPTTPRPTPNPTTPRPTPQSTPGPTPDPTPNPTPRPTPRVTPTPTSQATEKSAYDAAFDEMLEFAKTKSSSSSLSNPSSAQYKAVEWLAQDKVNNNSNWSGYELLQRYVLRVLYHSTGGQNWRATVAPYWFGGSQVCQWPNVNFQDLYCNGQQVYRIDLGADSLRGTIPVELGQLNALKELALYLNQLTGTIPSELGQLTALTLLNLRSNQLRGSIPVTLTQLVELKNIYLYNNLLTGQVPSGFCEAPFPNWRASAYDGNKFVADCMSEVQCDCCDQCGDEYGNGYCWNGSGFSFCG